MIPQEKAKELISRFSAHANTVNGDMNLENSKQCAIICVDEIIEELEDKKTHVDYNFCYDWDNKIIAYWEQVKQEIINL